MAKNGFESFLQDQGIIEYAIGVSLITENARAITIKSD